MQLSDNKFTPSHAIFLAIFFGGLAVVVPQVAKLLDGIDAGEFYDGTAITAVAFFIGLVGVIDALVAFLRNCRDLNAAHEGKGLLQAHWQDVRLSNRNATKACQQSALGRLSHYLNLRGMLATYIGCTLAAIGVIGTMGGSIVAFGGIERTIGAIGGAGGRLDMGGMLATFGGLRGAMISSIVAITMGVWSGALARFNKPITAHLYHYIERVTEHEYLGQLPTVRSPESIRLDQLTHIVKALNAKQIAGNKLLEQGNALLEQRQKYILHLNEELEKKLAVAAAWLPSSIECQEQLIESIGQFNEMMLRLDMSITKLLKQDASTSDNDDQEAA